MGDEDSSLPLPPPDAGGESLADLRKLAVELVERAGRLTLDYFQTDLEPDTKADGTPVTVADRGAEEMLRQGILEAFPSDSILGEEFGEIEGSSGRLWILDPIDGTKSFVHGVPLYGMLAAVVVDRRPVVGVIHFPALGETLAAHHGGGCTWNGKPVRVSSRTDLSAGLLLMSDVPHPGDPAYHIPPRLLAAAGRRRTWGDCYGYALVASGRAEVMIDPELEVWDAAPLQPIVEEAGGRFTDLEGNPTIWNRSAVATNGHLHDQVLELLRG